MGLPAQAKHMACAQAHYCGTCAVLQIAVRPASPEEFWRNSFVRAATPDSSAPNAPAPSTAERSRGNLAAPLTTVKGAAHEGAPAQEAERGAESAVDDRAIFAEVSPELARVHATLASSSDSFVIRHLAASLEVCILHVASLTLFLLASECIPSD